MLGFTPQQVEQMSFWQFSACVDGFNAAHGGEEKIEPPSSDEFWEAVAGL